jgi:hypothetical protein
MATFADIVYAYTLARGNRWEHTSRLLALDPFVAHDVVNFRSRGSGWTFLHQAAHLGNEAMAKNLVALGANRKIKAKSGHTPRAVAQPTVAAYLDSLDGSRWWKTSTSTVLVRRESHKWAEARACTAPKEIHVRYSSSHIAIPAGRRYYADARGRVLVGWHGTTNPPCDMSGYSLVREAAT